MCDEMVWACRKDDKNKYMTREWRGDEAEGDLDGWSERSFE